MEPSTNSLHLTSTKLVNMLPLLIHNASSVQGSNHLATINNSNKERRRSLPEVAPFTSTSLRNEVGTVLLR